MSWFKKTEQTESLDAILNKWKSQGITLYVHEQENRIVIDSLIVPKEQRKRGIGSQIMQELTDYADQVGKRIELSTGEKGYQGGTSRNRLIKFYKRFGLVQNRGRNKDSRTSNTMYREPML